MIDAALGNAGIWSAQVADLRKDHLAILADSRGHGRSTRTEEPSGYDLMASDYLALLDYPKIDEVDLVGGSNGGIIGTGIAMTHPERLDQVGRTREFIRAVSARCHSERTETFRSLAFDPVGLAKASFAGDLPIVAPDPLRAAAPGAVAEAETTRFLTPGVTADRFSWSAEETASAEVGLFDGKLALITDAPGATRPRRRRLPQGVGRHGARRPSVRVRPRDRAGSSPPA